MNPNDPHPQTPAPAGEPPSAHGGSPDERSLPRIGGLAILAFLLVFLLLFGALFLVGFLPRIHREAVLQEDAQAAKEALPIVEVGKPNRENATTDLILPGDTFAMQETAMFPRTSGYLKQFTVDIGDHVKAGQLLAQIDTPEVDAELSQAEASRLQAQAAVAKAKADLELAQNTYDRYAAYAKTGGVTKQQLDERQSGVDQMKAAYGVAQAAEAASEATVKRLTDLQGFEKIIAPFDGTITSRNYDVGTLLSATDANTGHEIFRITQDDPLRVFVNVPQAYITMVKPGQTAYVTVRNYPARQFEAKVVRSTAEVDPATRTLRFELHIANPDHALYSGMYCQARFQLHEDRPPLTIPGSALLFESDGLQVAVVRDGHAYFQHISVGRDLGTKVEVSEGLSGDEDVVLNPGERLVKGVQVEVAPTPSTPAPVKSAAAPPAPQDSPATRPAEEAAR